MFAVVAAVAADEFAVVFHVSQRGIHLQVGEPPVAVAVVEIVLAVLQEDADQFAFGFADQRR